MVKNALLNFFKNLFFVFIPMGIVYLAFLVAGFAVIAALIESTGDLLSRLSELIHVSSEQSSVSVNEFLAYALGQLKWNGSLLDVLRQILSTDWIRTTVKGFFETLNASSEGFEAEFTVIIGDFAAQLKAYTATAGVICSVGLSLAVFATRFALRRRTAKRGVKKFLIAHTVVPVVQSVIVVASVVLFTVIRYYSLLVAVALIVLSGGVSLMTSWLIHRDETMRLKDILNAKNLLLHILSAAVIVLIVAAVFLLLCLLSPLFALLLTIPLAVYALAVADVNTDAYVLSMINASHDAA